MDFTPESPTCISFCYGIGGLDDGLERVVGTLRHLCIVEIEAVAIANLVTKMEAGGMGPAPIWTDVKTFPAEIFRGRVDFLIGGYPCTPFSLAGKRLGEGDPRHLWPYFERAIKTIRPVCCIFENVDVHLTLGFATVCASLRNMGYAVEAGIYSAEEVGAPHERKRLFILAVRMDHTIGGRQQSRGEICARRNGVEPTGEECQRRAGLADDSELANAPIQSEREQDDKANTNAETGQTREVSGIGGSELGNTDFERPQGWGPRILQKCADQWASRANGPFARWPARPGEQQHEWEYPRTTITKHAARLLGGYGKKYPEIFQKRQIDQVAFDGFTGKIIPSLDLSVDGYGFREDFLRSLGNAVVAQTAEIAILNLMRKHCLR